MTATELATTCLVALPALGAAACLLTGSRARLVARSTALLTLTLAVGLAASAPDSLGPVSGPGFHPGLDGLSAPLAVLAALVATFVLFAAPARELERGACAAVLATLATSVGAYASRDLVVFATFWVLSLAPTAIRLHLLENDDGTLRRTFDRFLVLGTVPLLAAILGIGWTRSEAGFAAPLALSDVGALPVPGAHQGWILGLLLIAVATRAAVFPLHAWLPVLVERGPVSLAAPLASAQLGAFLLARVVMPLVPEAGRTALPVVAGLALFGAIYAAWVALGQEDVRRALGFVTTSKVSLVVVGLAEAGVESVHGALLQMLAVGLTAPALLLVVSAIEARTGTTRIDRLGGLAQRAPKLATAFFVLAVATVGAPGSPQFVAEDLLLHGLLTTHPVVATGLLLVTVLHGITLLRIFFRVFHGTPRDERLRGLPAEDLLPREVAVLASCVLLLGSAGIAPQPLLARHVDHVDALAAPAEETPRRPLTPREPTNEAPPHLPPDPPARDRPHDALLGPGSTSRGERSEAHAR